MPGFDLGLRPRAGGLTHVIDKGLGPRGWEDVLETSGDYIDVVKLGWGTAYVTPNLRAKLDVLRGKAVVLGGTLFEAVIAQGKLDEYRRWLDELGLSHVEISDGVIELPLQVAGHVRRSPAELDDVDVVAGRLEQVLDRARAEALVDHVREAGAAPRQLEEVRASQRAPPAVASPPPARRGRRSCRARRCRP